LPKSDQPKLFLRIAVPSPLRQCFDYLAQPDSPPPLPGTRIKIQFGRQALTGFVIESSTDSDLAADRIRLIDAVLDDAPLLDPVLLALYRWASDYYMYPLGLVLQTSLPKTVREGKPLPEPGIPCWQLTLEGEKTDAASIKRAPLQQLLLEKLQNYRDLTTAEASELLGRSAAATMKLLAARQLVKPGRRTRAAQPVRTQARPLPLNPEQTAALQALHAALGSFRCFLLEGVTGSGKTEVYLQLMDTVLQAGGQVLVLVPEISLTPQTIRRFASRFAAHIVSFHSGLGERERCEGWQLARTGTADIVIGTRSAVFTPLPRLGLVIIDEEHDSSYKQQEGFRYSARDVAIYRASMLKIPVVLGSATPSLESLHNALAGRYQLLQLTQRAGNAHLPAVRLLDLRHQELTEGFSASLLLNIRQQLQANRQVLVFLNRRGYAPLLLCRDCGWIAECPRCERSYTLHRRPAQLHCHHCAAQKPLPTACPACKSHELSAIGLGTERSEDLLRQLFPDYPVIRVDRDSTRARDSIDKVMETVQSGIPCILVGTQMLAKGHHFPGVTLVAVLDADSGLFSADFRSQENLGQLLTQVAGRAGRGDDAGQVVIQTWHSAHPVLQQLVGEGYGSFARTLLEQRKAGRLPPFAHSLLLRAEAGKSDLPQQFLQDVRNLALQQGSRGLEIFGPMQSLLGKKAGHFRYQLLLQHASRSALQRLGPPLLAALDKLPLARKVRWSVDVDPVDYS